MFQFICYRDDIFSFAEADTQKSCQCRNHACGIFFSVFLDHPHYNVQRIIKKMRRDLCLKAVQFTLSFGFLFLDHFPHQFFDPDCHLLNRASQMIHFKTSGSMDFDIQLSG